MISKYPNADNATVPILRMSAYERAEQYAISLGNDLKKLSLSDFVKDVESKFFECFDAKFRDYLVEIHPMEYRCVVPHTKLVEFGFMSGWFAIGILHRLRTMPGLTEGVDYICDRVTSIYKRPVHMLSPMAFKYCIIRHWRKYDNQQIDPVKYGRYIQVVEQCIRLHHAYKMAYSQKQIDIEKLIFSLSNKKYEIYEKLTQILKEIKEGNDDVNLKSRMSELLKNIDNIDAIIERAKAKICDA